MKLKTLIFGIAPMLMLPSGVRAATKIAEDARQLIVDRLKRNPKPLGAAAAARDDRDVGVDRGTVADGDVELPGALAVLETTE